MYLSSRQPHPDLIPVCSPPDTPIVMVVEKVIEDLAKKKTIFLCNVFNYFLHDHGNRDHRVRRLAHSINVSKMHMYISRPINNDRCLQVS